MESGLDGGDSPHFSQGYNYTQFRANDSVNLSLARGEGAGCGCRRDAERLYDKSQRDPLQNRAMACTDE